MKENVMKKILSIILVFAILVVMVGCGASAEGSETVTGDDSGSEEIIQENEHSSSPVEEHEKENAGEQVQEDPLPVDVELQEDPLPVDNKVQDEQEMELSLTQLNSIAMLNYLAALSQEINDSNNSRLFLEEAYATLINNTNPEAVDEKTEQQLSILLDTIEDYRMISLKRDLIQYFYEQNKAVAIKAAVPSVDKLFETVGDIAESGFSPVALVSAVVHLALDSYSSYSDAGSEMAEALADKAYLIDGLSLDDQEAEKLHECRKATFLYMIDIVREEHLPGNLALNESSISKFVEWKNKTNNVQKIQFFESEQNTYEAFGGYWLELASCYYEAKEYQKCLDSLARYESLKTNIFRKDYGLAEVMTQAIASCSFIYQGEEYIDQVSRYINVLLDNTDRDEWALRFFAAEMLVELYRRTGNEEYLVGAYDIEVDNVNFLVEEQKKLNNDYVADVQEISVSDSASKDEKKAIKEYNKALNELRKVQLPPIYEPLVVNCDLLFAIASKLSLSTIEKNKIDGILHANNAFLTSSLDSRYSFVKGYQKITASFDKDKIVLPLNAVSEQSHIVVKVTENGITTSYDDWTVDKVNRKAPSFEEYTVTFASKKMGKQKWSPDSLVIVEITEEGSNKADIVLKFKVSKYKDYKVYQTLEFEQIT